MAFVPFDRNESALHMPFFCCGRYQSATHIAFFYAGNMPYASGIAIPFDPGLENPAELRFVFGRGMENPSNFWFVFIRRIKNRIGIRFIRPLTWPFVGAYAIRPYTGTRKNGDFSIRSTTGVAVCRAYAIRPYPDGRNSIHFFVHSASGMAVCGAYAVAPLHGRTKIGLVFGSYFEGGAEKRAGCGLCEKWGRRASIIIRRLLPLRARRRMGPIIAPAHAFIIPNYVA